MNSISFIASHKEETYVVRRKTPEDSSRCQKTLLVGDFNRVKISLNIA